MERVADFGNLVAVESPFAGDIERNLKYARAAMSDCLHRGEYPIASHLLYTQPGILRDDIAAERSLGILAGFAWAEKAALRVIYTDLGISRGMQAGIDHAKKIGQAIEYRTLQGWIEQGGLK